MTTAQAAATEARRKSYVPVPLDIFVPDKPLEFTLFCRGVGNVIRPICLAGEALTAAQLTSQREAGARVFYVDTSEHRAYQQYAEVAMDNLAERDDLPEQRKAELCYQTTRELVRDAVQSSHPDALTGERRDKWTNSIVTLICNDEANVDGMLSMLSHDYYTYTHMVNVSVMVTALGYRMGERDPEKLRALASGGLLHDVGKLRVDPEVLNKTGRLSKREWEELQRHPDLGLGFLHGRQDIRPVELQMVHQHHEKLDGSGYPLGLLGREITDEAQMTAVVDIYDALTCKRPYRPAMPHDKALAILNMESHDRVNRDMVEAWRATMDETLAGASGG